MRTSAVTIASAITSWVIIPLSFGLAGLAKAQDSATSDQARGSETLVQVLSAAGATEFNGKVSISVEKQEEKLAGGIVRFVGGPMGNESALPVIIEGEFQLNVNDGAFAATTGPEPPSIKFYRNGDKSLNSITYSGPQPAVEKTVDTIAQVIDFSELAFEMKRVNRVREKEVDGGRQYRVTLNQKFFDSEKPSAKGGAGGMLGGGAMALDNLSESVLDGVLIVTTDSSGDLKTLKLEKQYNDPLGGMMEMALKGGGIKFSIGGDAIKKSDKPGRKVIVQFTVSDSESTEAKAFAAQAEKVLAN